MRHRKNKRKIGKNSGYGIARQKSLATSLILHDQIKTTEKRAKIAQTLVEKLITLSKKKSLQSKRRIHDVLKNKEAEKKLHSELSKKYKERKSGYTRILKIEKRLGDNADMVQIELV